MLGKGEDHGELKTANWFSSIVGQKSRGIRARSIESHREKFINVAVHPMVTTHAWKVE
jgi:hypothetical protein